MNAGEIEAGIAKLSDKELAKHKNLVAEKMAAGLPQQDAEEVALRQIEADAEAKPTKKSKREEGEKPEASEGGEGGQQQTA